MLIPFRMIMNPIFQLHHQIRGCHMRLLPSARLVLNRRKQLSQICVFTRELSSDEDVLTEMPLKDPVKGDLVYGGPLWKMVKGVKAFSVSTSIIALSAQPYILMNASDTQMATKLAVGGTLSFFIFVTPLMIHFVTKKYVRDCYYNHETGIFTASTFSFFLRRKEVQFKADDVVIPDVPGMFTTIMVKGKALFLDPKMFYSKDAYIHLMGYDRPIDWEMPDFRKKDSDNSKS